MIDRIGPKRPSRLYIREWIKEKNLDQKRTAERMECEPGTVSKLLSGKMEMTVNWLEAFAAALELTVPELFCDPKMPTRDELLAAGTADELRQAIRLVQMARTGTGG